MARLAGAAREHALFLALAAAGIALRAVTLLAYRPALFSPDTPGYLDAAERWTLPALHPIGYSLFLRAGFGVWDDYAFVPALQHVLGVATAVVLYATLGRLGVPRWLAALATAPVLLDAYQLNVEQYILSDTLFELALVAGCALLLWRQPVSMPLAALAGLAFAAATGTRVAGLLLVIPIALAPIVLRLRPARAAALLAGFLVPLVVYAGVFKSVNGTFGLTDYGGRYLYGRVIDWVDCREFTPADHERPLCPGRHAELEWVYQYLWTKRSPLYDIDPPPGLTRNDVAGSFAKRAILNQPLTYAQTVASDWLLTFAPTKFERRGEFRVSQWQFQLGFPIPNQQRGWTVEPPAGHSHGTAQGTVDRGLAEFLRAYQRFAYVPGPVLAACLLVALAGAIGIGRARHSGLRGAVVVFLGPGVVLWLGSVASTMFAWRYQLPLLVLLPPAAALALTAYLRPATDRTAAAGRARRSDRR